MAEYVCEVVTEHELCGDVHHYVRRERITRCRDCVNSGFLFFGMYCGYFSVPEDGYYVVISPDDFCSKGEPREEE